MVFAIEGDNLPPTSTKFVREPLKSFLYLPISFPDGSKVWEAKPHKFWPLGVPGRQDEHRTR
jgi:hypothetical protein